MRLRSALPALLVLALTSTACASSSSGGPRQDQNVLTREQVLDVAANDLFSVIQSLRPRWLQARNQMQSDAIGVILNGVRDNGGVSILYQIRPADVEEVRFMNARDAQTRYGGGLVAGAIIVTIRR